MLYTGKHVQLVLMSLKPGEEIGMEIHPDVDQFFRFEAGTAKVVVDGQEQTVEADEVVVIPAGSQHNVTNTGDQPLKLYTIYSPPNHPHGTIHTTKADADAYEQEHHQ